MLRESVEFDDPVQTAGEGGVVSTDWVPKHACRAVLIYHKGGEVVEAARLEGRSIYKVKIRSCIAARYITTDWQMRDVRREITYSLSEVDAVTDPRWIYIVAEAGKASG